MSVYVDIEKQLGSFDLKVKFEAGDEVLALLGASGCGKSMTLKCIAGIEKPDRGKIIVDGITLFDSEKHIDLTPQKRRTGLLFQNYALFPNMTVLQNIRTGARRGKNSGLRDERIKGFMENFGLTELSKRYPSQLSGGQQQRVALARILVSSPHILLLDEPFSALDSHLRFRLEQEVLAIIRDFGKTVILVSHDRDEVFRLSDRIAVISDGKVEAIGSKAEVFAQPQTVNAAILTGCKNISVIEKLGPRRIRAVDWGMELNTFSDVGEAKNVGVRMHYIEFGPGENAFVCDVVSVIENPFSFTVMLRPVGEEKATPIGWEMDKEKWNEVRAERLEIHLPPESIVLLEG